MKVYYNSKLRSNNQAPNSNVLAIDKVSGFYQSVFPYTNTSVKWLIWNLEFLNLEFTTVNVTSLHT